MRGWHCVDPGAAGSGAREYTQPAATQLAGSMLAAGLHHTQTPAVCHSATHPGPTIALSMGEKGQITRLLAAKYGGHLTFAALSAERASAPGQPTIEQLKVRAGR